MELCIKNASGLLDQLTFQDQFFKNNLTLTTAFFIEIAGLIDYLKFTKTPKFSKELKSQIKELCP